LLAVLLAAPTAAPAFQLFRTEEATIADIQAALTARTLTCRALVQMYLDRIEAYDKKGPGLNAIVTINPDALKVADALDAKLARSGPAGPLHCVPIIGGHADLGRVALAQGLDPFETVGSLLPGYTKNPYA